MMKWITFLVAIMIAGIMAIATFGCGSNHTPSETVDKLFQLTKEKNCQRVADLVSDTSTKTPDTYVNECKQIAERLVSYSIKGETIYKGGNIAAVDTDVTIKQDGREKTNSVPQILVKRGDEWKLTTFENH